MDLIDLVVIFGGAALIGLLAWYFFAPRNAVSAELRGGMQQVDIEVRGGGIPLTLSASARESRSGSASPAGQQRLHQQGRFPGSAQKRVACGL